jgi:hypothetical protein
VAKIARQSLFYGQEIEELGDLERLQFLLENLPDEPLMRELEIRCGNGRDDSPDGRRDLDVDWGTKTYKGKRADGSG